MTREKHENEIVPSGGYTRPISVGLKEDELRLLDEHAERLGVRRNAVMRFLIRYGLEMLETGAIEVPVQRRRKIRVQMP